MNFTKEVLNDVIDLHVHVGPSIANRKIDAIEMMTIAEKASYRGFLIKDHYFPTCMSARLANKHSSGKCTCYSGIVLNKSVGSFNLNAIDVACGMGAKMVCMPTVSSINHIIGHSGRPFVGGGLSSIVDVGSSYIDSNGDLIPEADSALRFLSSVYPDIVLFTGHGSLSEVNAVVNKATEYGLKRIVVNHPFFLVNATVEQMKHWADLGAFIELNAAVFKSVSRCGTVDDRICGDILEIIPENRVIIDSDMGQMNNHDPIDGLLMFLNLLNEKYGLSKENIELMCKKNPAYLLGLNT